MDDRIRAAFDAIHAEEALKEHTKAALAARQRPAVRRRRLAPLLACLVTYRLRNIRFKGLALAASLPPVLFNAVIIGIEIAVMFPDPTSSAPIWLACITNGISVGIGELISCTVLGVVLVKLIESNAALRKVFVTE